MAAEDPPDPLVAVLGEIRDVLAEIRDRMPAPVRVAPTSIAKPVQVRGPAAATRSAPTLG